MPMQDGQQSSNLVDKTRRRVRQSLKVILTIPKGYEQSQEMKIINARTGKLENLPLALGEKGRGRWYEEVKTSNRPGQEPAGPEDVSYFTFGQDKKHVILTKADDKRGILLRINTSGTYTKGSCGSVALKGGKATMLTQGTWAEGDAGRIANGPDQLWHVEGPAAFVVILQGGEYKGMGHRYLIVTKSLGTLMIKRADLCQMIATDDNPEVTEVARMFRTELHEDVQQALLLAEQLEEQMDVPQANVIHFTSEYRTMEEVIKDHGLAIPAAMNSGIGGVDGVQSGTIVPGSKALVALDIGPGGGKRYRFEELSERGITRLEETYERPYTRRSILALVEDSNWSSAWKEYKDGELLNYAIADSGGIHRFTPDAEWGDPIRTDAWAGMPPKTPTQTEFQRVFGLNAYSAPADSPKWDEPEPKPQAPAGGWSISDLKTKFGR